MGKDLKSENLAICVPNFGCNKRCPYCVSHMTCDYRNNPGLMRRNIEKVLHISKSAEITSVLFTGKGEPTLEKSLQFIFTIAHHFKQWPMEIQTNGIVLLKKPQVLYDLIHIGFDVFAISLDNEKQFYEYESLFKNISAMDSIARITVNINQQLGKYLEFKNLISYCKSLKIRQLTLRRIVAPERWAQQEYSPLYHDAITWVKENVMTDKEYQDYIDNIFTSYTDKMILIRTLNSGAKIYDVDGISFVQYDYCIQEHDNGDNLRSLIFHQDGHLYTSWNSRASILF